MAWFRAFEQVKAKYGEEINPHRHPYNTEIDKIMKKTEDNILSDCASILNEDGGILIVSSRYAYHGGGYPTDKLPEEKRMNLGLVKRFQDLGAKEVCLIGLSKDKISQDLSTQRINEIIEEMILEVMMDKEMNEHSVSYLSDSYRKSLPRLEAVAPSLTDDDVLFSNYGRSQKRPDLETVKQIKAMNMPLGRIDAVYARF
ncbi:hypothetical protein KY343_07055 [Candidatus Woesearchaeota archaeon]|nr:hypothetical protein [Candidatus Woesearchaeota archaeon]